MDQRHRCARAVIVAAFAVCCGILLASRPAAGAGGRPPAKVKVYVYPEKLTPKDKLSFGQGSQEKGLIPIKGESTLIYVDLDSEARFAHETQCVLISAEGARVINGDWWLTLNGKDLFRPSKAFDVKFPLELKGK